MQKPAHVVQLSQNKNLSTFEHNNSIGERRMVVELEHG